MSTDDTNGANLAAEDTTTAKPPLGPVDGREPWSTGAKIGWSIATLTIGMAFVFAMGNHAFGPPKTLNDFVQEWTSARNHLIGDPIYAPLDESIEKHLQKRVRTDLIKVNAHPPASVLLALPVAKFRYDQALRLWNAVSFLALGLSLALMFSRLALNWNPWFLLPVFTLLISSNPMAQQVLQGQLNLLLLLLVTAFWVAARRQQWWIAGVLVGLAGAIKLFPLYLGLYFLMRRRIAGVLGVGVGFFGLNAVAWAVLGGESFHDFFTVVAPSVAAEFQSYWPNASINGFFRKSLDGSVGHTIPLIEAPTVAVVLTMIGMLAVTWLAGRRAYLATSDAEQDIAISMCVAAMLLVSPITWDHYFVILVPFIAVIWKHADSSSRVALFVLILLLFTVRPTWIWDVAPGGRELALRPGDVPAVGETWHVLTVLSYQFYCLVALLLIANRTAAQQRQPE